jgi:hypothetical protein
VIPKPIGHAVSVGGDPLTIYPGIDDLSRPIAFRNTDGAGPYAQMVGCPNCRKYADEWWDSLMYAAAQNSGIDPDAPCSSVCRYQLEYQAELAANRLTS